MDRYPLKERVEILSIYFKNGHSVRSTFRALRKIYGRRGRPTENTIRRIVKKFQSSGSLQDKRPSGRRRNARSDENINAVRESFIKKPNLSISQRAKELGLSLTSTWRILHQLGLLVSKTSPEVSENEKNSDESSSGRSGFHFLVNIPSEPENSNPSNSNEGSDDKDHDNEDI